MKTLNAALARALLPVRCEFDAKWEFGRALLLCGSVQFSGAALMASEAALRSGAGLVQLCSAPEVIAAARVRLPECLLQTLYAENDFAVPSACMEKSTAVLFGCGYGISDVSRMHLRQVLTAPTLLVLDADGLNLLAEEPGLLQKRQGNTVLTPHHGEFCRLSGCTREELQAHPQELARSFAKKYQVTVVLKGAATVITDGRETLVLDAPNSGMAKGGSGDILAGLTVGLLAQGLSPMDGAALAVYLHSQAGALARERMGEYSMLPRDVLAALPEAFLSLQKA